MFDYLKEMQGKYGGFEDGICSLVLEEDAARLLMVEENFLDYLEFLEDK